ncbi:MAG: tetratricopeptide repeat protein [Candidatus Zixiibacteriota bacterium]|nr:MAG: tetratricopeptide repeat protein [candidate division Zixibacteria bacterium]
MLRTSYRINLTVITALVLGLLAGCVYYNTFFNAKKSFDEAERTRRKSRLKGGRVKEDLYQIAIDKSLKVVENYPNSKYYDDALYVLGVSYFYVRKYSASERRLRELLANYGDSKFADESELYLAKAKLELKNEEGAMELFEGIFGSDVKRSYKAEAAIALGNYHFREKNFERSRQYFLAVRDSLGMEDEKKMAQRMIADSYFEGYNFRDALGAYIQMLGLSPDKDDEYHALYNAARSSFRLMRIESGLDYLRRLSDNEAYYDSLSVIKLLMGSGYEYDDDLSHAEDIYLEVLEQEQSKVVAGEAAYRLGLIHQFDYDDLPKAKEYYDRAVRLSRGSDFAKDALERSSDIGKVETYTQSARPGATASQEVIDAAARTQYQLAELYWLNLNKPDSAMIEMQYVIDSFPTSTYAPKAMIALSHMYSEHKDDRFTAYQIMRDVPRLYPRSDYVPEALEALEFLGSKLDTGYAAVYLRRAEDFLVDEQNVDSARAYYQYIVDSFPDSRHYTQAQFSLIWLTEMYESTGDSSVYHAYSAFAEANPKSEWAKVAEQRMGVTRKVTTVVRKIGQDTTQVRRGRDDDGLLRDFADESDTSLAADPLESVYIGPNGERLRNVPVEPIEIREEFVYPVEAYRIGFEGDLYFQIFLDFSGEVVDYILKIRCDSEDINREASEAVASMIFDPLRIPQEQQETWMVYKFEVRKPEHIR